LGQEMGHGYGLDHSRADSNPGVDYQDPWDIMSTANAYEAPNPKYTSVGPLLNAANMAGRGWLNESRVFLAAGPGTVTVTLRPLVRRNLPGLLAARAGIYLVEFRVKEGWDAGIPQPTVLVHRFADNHSYIMSGIDGREDLVAGSVFQVGDPNGNLPWTKVEVLSMDPDGSTATLRLSSN
jgi:hypothetical protein